MLDDDSTLLNNGGPNTSDTSTYSKQFTSDTNINANNLQSICRICAKTSYCNRMKNLFSPQYSAFLRNIEKIAGMTFENRSYFPQNICRQCREDLRQACAFRSQCIKAQHYFNIILKPTNEIITIRSFTTEKISNNEGTVVVEADVDYSKVIATESDYENYDDIETIDIIKDESELIGAVTISEELLDDLQKLFRDDGAETICVNDENSQLLDLEHGFHSYEGCKKSVTEKPHTKIPEKFKLSKRKPPEKPYNKTNNYICEQCGSYFNNTNHFESHMNKHAGFKPYQCEFCKKKFLTKSVMKSHRRIHTGERPFACSYCGKRFRNSGMRVVHERIHTNERPHVCSRCNKGFSTKSSLTEHMEVHTTQRLHSCNICNKDFKRRTHLTAHLRSIGHMQNEENIIDNMEYNLKND